jgi:hypothetical protein
MQIELSIAAMCGIVDHVCSFFVNETEFNATIPIAPPMVPFLMKHEEIVGVACIKKIAKLSGISAMQLNLYLYHSVLSLLYTFKHARKRAIFTPLAVHFQNINVALMVAKQFNYVWKGQKWGGDVRHGVVHLAVDT